MSFQQGVLSALGKVLLLQIGRGLELDVTPGMKFGSDVTTPSIEDAFVRIYAIKNAKKPDAKLVRVFRGAK
jgi:hypothetical protein